MVAGDRDVIADLVHELDVGCASRHGSERLALDRVAIVDEQNMVAVCHKLVADNVKAGIRPVLIHAAMHVACEKNDDVALQSRFRRFVSVGKAAEEHRENKENCDEFLHTGSTSRNKIYILTALFPTERKGSRITGFQ